jgi:hypothetical protein
MPGNKADKWDDGQLREVLREVMGLPSERFLDERVATAKRTHTMPDNCTCDRWRNHRHCVPVTTNQPLTARHAAQCKLDSTRGTKHNAVLQAIYEACCATIPCRGGFKTGSQNRAIIVVDRTWGPDVIPFPMATGISRSLTRTTLATNPRDRCL